MPSFWCLTDKTEFCWPNLACHIHVNCVDAEMRPEGKGKKFPSSSSKVQISEFTKFLLNKVFNVGALCEQVSTVTYKYSFCIIQQ